MLTKPVVEVITTVDDLRGKALIKPGPVEKDTGGKGLRLRKSYTFTSGSGNGRDCLS